MKVLAVEHDRCNELDKTDYYVIPDAMSYDDATDVIRAAQEEYLAVYKALQEEAKLPPPPSHDIRTYDDHTTAASVKQKLAEYDALVKKRNALLDSERNCFASHLRKHGIVTVSEFIYTNAEINPERIITLYWGHRHGERLKY